MRTLPRETPLVASAGKASSAWDEYQRAMTWHKPAPQYVTDPDTGRQGRSYSCRVCRDEGTVGIRRKPEEQYTAYACPACRPQTMRFRRLGLPEKELLWAVSQGEHKRPVSEQEWLMDWLDKENRRLGGDDLVTTRVPLRIRMAGIGKPMPNYRADESVEVTEE